MDGSFLSTEMKIRSNLLPAGIAPSGVAT